MFQASYVSLAVLRRDALPWRRASTPQGLHKEPTQPAQASVKSGAVKAIIRALEHVLLVHHFCFISILVIPGAFFFLCKQINTEFRVG